MTAAQAAERRSCCDHLFEQPTVFYAVALARAVLGRGSGIKATLACE